MKSRITVLTLGVDNLEKSFAFYHNGLGFASKGIVGTEFDHGAVAFFDLENGITLALYPRKSLGLDASIPQTASSLTELFIGQNVGSKEEVDSVMALAQKAGAKITDHARKRFWGGYSGYFQDPAGIFGKSFLIRTGYRLNDTILSSEHIKLPEDRIVLKDIHAKM